MLRCQYFAGCFLWWWKVILQNLKSMLQSILKISRKNSFNDYWRYHHINKLYCAIRIWKKYFTFFLMWKLLIKNFLVIYHFLKHYQTDNLINKLTVGDNFINKCTAQNYVISPNFLLWKLCGKAQFPHRFGRIARNYAETVPFHKISTPGN